MVGGSLSLGPLLWPCLCLFAAITLLLAGGLAATFNEIRHSIENLYRNAFGDGADRFWLYYALVIFGILFWLCKRLV